MPRDLYDLSSPTRYQTLGPWQGNRGVLTTGPPGNSQVVAFLIQTPLRGASLLPL